jgi:hypothetical protein
MRRRAVVPWAVAGALLSALAVVILTRWIASGVTTVDPGPDDPGTGSLVVIRVLEWSQLAVTVGLVWAYVLRPLLHRIALPFDGLLLLAALALNVWDPLDNYLRFAFAYNAHHVNVASWGEFIPGWQSPSPELWAVPIAFAFGAYVWAFLGAAKLGCRILDRLERTRPSWGPARRWGTAYAACWLIAAAAELVYLRADAITNLRTPDALTLWADEPYRWPVYNPFLFAAAYMAFVAVRHSAQKHGLSFVERGAGTLGLGARATTIVRFLAISAYAQVTYVLLYFLPFNLLALAGPEPFPRPSYFPTP